MSNVYFETRYVRVTRDKVDLSSLEIDYPHIISMKTKSLELTLIQIRRWCERNLKFDVFFKEDYRASSGYIDSYYWNIYFENKDDALKFKLTFYERT